MLFIILVAETHDCHRMWSGPGDFSSPTSSYSSELHIYYVRCLLQFIGYHGNKITRLHVTFISLLIILLLALERQGVSAVQRERSASVQEKWPVRVERISYLAT